MRSRLHEAWGCGFKSAFGSMFMTIGSVSGVPTVTGPSCTTNATFESPLIAIACDSVAFKRKALIATPQVLLKVPPYVDVRSVAVATTCGSGDGSVATDVEFESSDVVDAAKVIWLVEVAVLDGVGVGLAIGLRSVVANTTI